jgi:hypothetical protein
MGVSAVSAALGCFADAMITSSREWYVDALLVEDLQTQRYTFEKIKLWIELHANEMLALLCWFVWLYLMIIFFCSINNEWSFVDGFLFAISGLCSSGLLGISDDSSNWKFSIGFFFLNIFNFLFCFTNKNVTTI